MSAASTPDRSATAAGPFEGMDAVEIKVTIPPDKELRAERTLQVDEDSASVRVIYFYDTPDLDLLNAGAALRARLVKGDADDSTVKFRPVESARVGKDWRLKGFKMEADWVGDRVVCSASITRLQERDEISGVANGKRSIDKLFSKDQERFLREFCKKRVDFGMLRVMGPIRVLRWKLKHERFTHKLTVEEWRLPNGDDLVEVSFKVPPRTAHQAQVVFEDFLRNLGVDPDCAQETKTRMALEYFSGLLRAAGA